MPASNIANSIISQLGAVDSYPNKEYVRRQLNAYREEVIIECQDAIKDLGVEIVTCSVRKLTGYTIPKLIWHVIRRPYTFVRSLFLCTMRSCYHTLEDLKE